MTGKGAGCRLKGRRRSLEGLKIERKEEKSHGYDISGSCGCRRFGSDCARDPDLPQKVGESIVRKGGGSDYVARSSNVSEK
jgi:hypothetical protein